MDLFSLFSMLFYPISFLSVAYILYLIFTSNSGNNLPPGKTGLPIIGESINFMRDSKKGCPDKFISERMQKFSSTVFKTSLFFQPVAVFCGAAGNKFLFSNENKLVRSWFPEAFDKIFVSTESSTQEESKKAKKLLPNFVKPEALQRFVSIMDIIAQRHFDSDWNGKQQVTVLPLAKKYTFGQACRLFLSIEDPEHLAKLISPFDVVVEGVIAIPINIPGTTFNHAIKAAKVIRKEIVKIIKQRKIDVAENKASLTQDILSHMLTTQDEDGKLMNEEDIATMIIGMLMGGYDTASGVITFVVKYLAEFPQVYNRVFEEQIEIAKSKEAGEFLNWSDIQKMKYSWNVACEVMRLEPPAQGMFREAIMDFTFNGCTIPKGWKLYWTVYSTHYNPEFFEEPKKFDPLRFEGKGPAPYTFVPFGGGPRMCPGKEFARLQILVFMHNLVKSCKWKKVLPNEKTIVKLLRVPANGLPIRLFPVTSSTHVDGSVISVQQTSKED